MRKRDKQGLLELIRTVYNAHDEIKKLLKLGDTRAASGLIADCQESLLNIGEVIIQSEGEQFVTIGLVEDYCREIFNVYNSVSDITDFESVRKTLNRMLTDIKKSIDRDVVERKEIVFMPYKASMWDSLESVWKAADADPECDAYVVPIPYYDRNPDHSFGEFHYEGGEYPDYVPVTHYNNYDISKRRPDVIYIHNPYDDCNYVTSVDPRFYSFNLKKYTDTLVYIPHFSTAGGMSEGQRSCSAYYHADYIVIQSEKYRDYYDDKLPDKKFLAFGSPKFDSIINKCKNPPSAPENWKDKMSGKRVYFYNTSIGGMLADTEVFLKKMKYVFDTFSGRDDACLLWRPHPLLESTFESMRSEYIQEYINLRDSFIKNDVGIYDQTPDITTTISLCDAYVGDSGTSVTSLFGIAGKPLFILNNNIDSLPEDSDWRGEYIRCINDQWAISPNNCLYYSPERNFKYKFLCELSNYTGGWYYSGCISAGEFSYVIPGNARSIVKVNDKGIIKCIQLKQGNENSGAFAGAVVCGKIIYILPNYYPWIVRLDTETDELEYISDNSDFIIREVNGARMRGGAAYMNGKMYIASASDDSMLIVDVKSGRQDIISLNVSGYEGCIGIYPDKDRLWLLPTAGRNVICWNPDENSIRIYSDFPDDFICVNALYKYKCYERPFSDATRSGDYIYFSPYWANMFIRINTVTDKIEKWIPSVEFPENIKNGYYYNTLKSVFIYPSILSPVTDKLFSFYDNKLYSVNFEKNIFNELEIGFNKDELISHERGFEVDSPWLQYCCKESAFNTLEDFIDDNITGQQFDKSKQLNSFRLISADYEGNCGNKVHEYIKREINISGGQTV